MKLFSLAALVCWLTFGSGGGVDAVASRGGVIVVANKQDNTASIVDAADGKVLATVPVGVGPHEVATSRDGRWAVVTNYGDRQTVGSSLSVLDLRSRTVARTITLGEYKRPHGVAFLPGDRKLAVTSETSQAVLLVDFAAGTVDAAIPTGQPASHMLAVSRDGTRAYTANIVAGTVTELDLANRKAGRVLSVAPMVEGIAISPDGKQLWVGSNQSHTVSVVDTDRWQVVDTLSAPGMPYRIAFAPDGKRAVVTSPVAGLIRIFDVATRKELAALPAAADAAEPGPVGVVVSTDGTHAYVALQGTNQIAVVDLKRAAVVAHLPTGSGPDGIAHASP